MSDSEKESKKPSVDTGGGAYIGGSVDTGGGKFVGRDDRSSDINVGNVSGSGIAIGHGAQASVQQGTSAAELAQAFAAIYKQIDQRRDDPDVGKDEISNKVKEIEQEVAKGKGANDAKVKRWLGNLGEMAPDILNVTVAALANPAAGAAQAIRLIAKKALQDQG